LHLIGETISISNAHTNITNQSNYDNVNSYKIIIVYVKCSLSLGKEMNTVWRWYIHLSWRVIYLI